MIQEDEIRAAFGRLAEQAPGPDRVQSQMQGAVRAHRQRRALLVAGGVAAGVGVTGGLVTVGRWILHGTEFGPDVRTPANLPSPVIWPPQAGNTTVPLRYRPTWLPDGYVELVRATTVGSPPAQLRQRRAWYQEHTASQAIDAAHPLHIALELMPATPEDIADQRSPVWVNGARGGLGPGVGGPILLWEAGGGLNLALTVGGFPDNRMTALQIARSVVPEEVSTVEVSLSFGWLPEIGGGVLKYETRPDGSSLGVVVDRGDVLNVVVDRQTVDGTYETEPITLRGGTGQWFRSEATVMVWLTLPDGRLLQATVQRDAAPGVYLTDADVLRVIEELRIGARPDNRWIGTR